MCCVVSLLTVLYCVTFITAHGCSKWQALMTLVASHLAKLVNGSFCYVLQVPCLLVLQKDELNRLRDGEGRPPGVMGWWPSRATTFLENHDTVWPLLLAGPAFFFSHQKASLMLALHSQACIHLAARPAGPLALLCVQTQDCL